MGASFGDDDDVIADINITPFVDIILVVLIIFMVAAPQLEDNSSIKVSLPDAATGEATESISLGITLTAEGGLALDGETTTPAALTQALRKAKSEGDVTALIAADKAVAHGRLIWLLDTLRSEGIVKYAIQIDKATAVPPDPATTGQGTAQLPPSAE